MTEALNVWRVRWKNFRGYAESPTIEFPALTLLIGRNNTGKTSTYAPLLLLRQTLAARDPATALLFRGGLVDFGTYEDVVTDHDVDRKISMRLDFGLIDEPWLWDDYGPQSLEVTFERSGEHTANLERSVLYDAQNRAIVTRSRDSKLGYRVTSSLLPKNTEVGRPVTEVTALRRALQGEEPTGFLFSGVGGIRIPATVRRNKDRWEKLRHWYEASNALYDIYAAINGHIVKALNGISYIGPLRSAPQRSYLLSPEAPSDVGRDGQWASEVLYRAEAQGMPQVLDRTNQWLERLGYGKLSFRSLGDYFQVLVEKPGSGLRVNLLDCGAGLSQLLPLLVQGCIMDTGDTLVAQQPEIHLNPAQQDLMTDFLIELSNSGRRVIIETHSEHVLVRLRRRIAEEQSIGPKDVALYFSDTLRSRSTLHQIGIDEWGQVSQRDWPAGFFNEQLDNSMKLALAQSRRKRRLTRAEGE